MEPRALEAAFELQAGAVDVVLARGVDEDAEPVVGGDGVVLLGFEVEPEAVGQPRTAALLDEQSESRLVGVVPLLVDELQRLFGGRLGYDDGVTGVPVRVGGLTHAER